MARKTTPLESAPNTPPKNDIDTKKEEHSPDANPKNSNDNPAPISIVEVRHEVRHPDAGILSPLSICVYCADCSAVRRYSICAVAPVPWLRVDRIGQC
jgi:hypothetical protein